MRTHGSEGATEPGRDGPGPVGPVRPAWPTPEVGSAPLLLAREDTSTLRRGGTAIRRDRTIRSRGRPQAREKRRGRSFARRIVLLEGSTHKWRRRKIPSEASP
jgi:hypothetical protein